MSNKDKETEAVVAPGASREFTGMDTSCFYESLDNYVRVLYPGHVKNVDKAILCLGGLDALQKAVDGKKLELNFNPTSQYKQGCAADSDQNLGILIKGKQDEKTKKVTYKVLGLCDTNFKFSRMCDFQYLPLIPKEAPETKESEVDFVYKKIILDKLPSLEWFTKKECFKDSLFLTCGNYARFDLPQSRFQTSSAEVINSTLRADAPQLVDFGKRPVKNKTYVSSYRISFLKEAEEIPQEPPEGVLKNVNTHFLKTQLQVVKKLFDERPMWTKPAILHKANIQFDTAKQILPCLAYFCSGGPFRTCWVKLGYNPLAEYNSRVFQILDFRIRHTEGMQIKIKTKRTIAHNLTKEFRTTKWDDVNYIMRPNQIPPARQMFYQYCDIHLSEVQDMLAKLPKLPSTAKFHPKNGWLPLSFQEQCREIVNRYVFDAVQQEVLKEKRSKSPENVATFCSQMLNDIKLGPSTSGTVDSIVEHIDLSDHGEEEVDVNVVVDSLPEHLEEEDDSDLDINMDVLEEVNQMVGEQPH